MNDRISKKIQETKTNRKIKIIKNKKKSKKEFRKISKNKKNIEEKSRKHTLHIIHLFCVSLQVLRHETKVRSNGHAVLEIFEFEGSIDLISYRISA